MTRTLSSSKVTSGPSKRWINRLRPKSRNITKIKGSKGVGARLRRNTRFRLKIHSSTWTKRTRTRSKKPCPASCSKALSLALLFITKAKNKIVDSGRSNNLNSNNELLMINVFSFNSSSAFFKTKKIKLRKDCNQVPWRRPWSSACLRWSGFSLSVSVCCSCWWPSSGFSAVWKQRSLCRTRSWPFRPWALPAGLRFRCTFLRALSTFSGLTCWVLRESWYCFV